MKTLKKFVIVFLVPLGCVGGDRVTKNMARHSLADAGTIGYLGDTFRLQYAENAGGFLSLGATIPGHLRPWIFSGFVGGLLLALLIYLLGARRMNRARRLALSLVLGGGLGNLWDRIFNDGRVVDFMNLGIGSLRTGIFNVADVAITAGLVWLAWLSLTGSAGSGGLDPAGRL